MKTVIIGVDMEIGSSPHAKRIATYSVHIDTGVAAHAVSGITIEKLYDLINEYKPQYLAIDNFLELTGSIKRLNGFLARVQPTDLIQTTLYEHHSQSLTQLASDHLGWQSGKPTSAETAKLCVELVKLGIGSIILGYRQKSLKIQPLSQTEAPVMVSKRTFHSLQQKNPYLNKRNILMNFGKGKDAIIYLSEQHGEYHVLKYYDPNSPSIGKLEKDIVRKSPLSMAKNEARILQLLPKSYPSPQFIERSGSVVVMEAIGSLEENQFILARQLSQVSKLNGHSEELFEKSMDLLHELVIDNHIVHGDFSPHNILISNNQLTVIDFAHSHEINFKTFTDTPYKIRMDRALQFLKNDLISFYSAFSKRHRLEMDLSNVYGSFIQDFPGRLLDLCDPKLLEF